MYPSCRVDIDNQIYQADKNKRQKLLKLCTAETTNYIKLGRA
jgi:hypothetical protein